MLHFSAFFLPTFVCIVACALQASLKIQEQFNFPISQRIEIILPPFFAMLSALANSSFKTAGFPFLHREYCRAGGNVQYCR